MTKMKHATAAVVAANSFALAAQARTLSKRRSRTPENDRFRALPEDVGSAASMSYPESIGARSDAGTAGRSGKSSKSPGEDGCPGDISTFYSNLTEIRESQTTWSAGEVKIGRSSCTTLSSGDELCRGDRGVTGPVPIYLDEDFDEKAGSRVGVYTWVSVAPVPTFEGSSTLVFDDEFRSELHVIGLGARPSDAIDLPVAGGTGAYEGASGDVKFVNDLDAGVQEITLCLV
ncbi:hypothetical protein ACHAWF_006062 [Thalassiosira exigua]